MLAPRAYDVRMAANDYLKVAAAQLRRAADFLQHQASELLSERMRVTSRKNNEITKHQLELKTKQAEAWQADDSQEKRQYNQEMHDLSKRIDDKKQEIKQANDALGGAARTKQQAAQELSEQARGLESKASSPEMTS